MSSTIKPTLIILQGISGTYKSTLLDRIPFHSNLIKLPSTNGMFMDGVSNLMFEECSSSLSTVHKMASMSGIDHSNPEMVYVMEKSCIESLLMNTHLTYQENVYNVKFPEDQVKAIINTEMRILSHFRVCRVILENQITEVTEKFLQDENDWRSWTFNNLEQYLDLQKFLITELNALDPGRITEHLIFKTTEDISLHSVTLNKLISKLCYAVK